MRGYMPKGNLDTVTCQNCGEGWPNDFTYCPTCGNKLPLPRESQTITKKDVGRVEDILGI